MPELGKKYTCYSCHTKFYDLGKPVPVCPKCGADQRDSEDTAVVTPARSRSRIVEEPVEEPDFEAETPVASDEEEEDVIEPVEPDREVAEEEEEEEEF